MDLIRYGKSDNNTTGNDIDLHRNGNISNDKHMIMSFAVHSTNILSNDFMMWEIHKWIIYHAKRTKH